MRTWYVPLEMLDDNRVVAQHREIHTVLGSVMSVRKGYQNHPVTKLYIGEHLRCLVSYHEVSVMEMLRRAWTGHKTEISSEITRLASERTTLETCASWDDHVVEVVPDRGPNSVDADIHDLVERWTNENKFLRNDIAADIVSAHAVECISDCCRTYSHSLVSEFIDRKAKQLEKPGLLIPTKGNASLKGRLELLIPQQKLEIISA